MNDEQQQDLDDFMWNEQEMLDQRRREEELRKSCKRARLWLVSDELPPINWAEPF